MYLELFKKFGWKQVALLSEDGQEFPEYHAFLQDHFLANGISVVYHRKMPRQATPDDAAKVIIVYWMSGYLFTIDLMSIFISITINLITLTEFLLRRIRGLIRSVRRQNF